MQKNSDRSRAAKYLSAGRSLPTPVVVKRMLDTIFVLYSHFFRVFLKESDEAFRDTSIMPETTNHVADYETDYETTEDDTNFGTTEDDTDYDTTEDDKEMQGERCESNRV